MAEFRYARAADVEKQTCVFCVAAAARYTRAGLEEKDEKKGGKQGEKRRCVYVTSTRS